MSRNVTIVFKFKNQLSQMLDSGQIGVKNWYQNIQTRCRSIEYPQLMILGFSISELSLVTRRSTKRRAPGNYCLRMHLIDICTQGKVFWLENWLHHDVISCFFICLNKCIEDNGEQLSWRFETCAKQRVWMCTKSTKKIGSIKSIFSHAC